jgi:hypothetical protein
MFGTGLKKLPRQSKGKIYLGQQKEFMKLGAGVSCL